MNNLYVVFLLFSNALKKRHVYDTNIVSFYHLYPQNAADILHNP